MLSSVYLTVLDDQSNEEQFIDVYNTYKRPVYHTAYKIMGDSYLAEDVLQEVFLYVAKNFSKIHRENCHELTAYLVSCSRSRAYDMLRKRREELLEEIPDAQKELDELPTPAQLKERYPDTSRWDAHLKAALHKRRPMLKRVLVAALTLVILTLGALAASADFRKVVYTMIQKFLPIEMQLTYQVDGEPLEQLPNGYSDHYVPDGFERNYEQGYDNRISFLHTYVDVNDKNVFYYVDCSTIQDYGQIETFDNEHTVYKRIILIKG